MATAGVCFFPCVTSLLFRRKPPSQAKKLKSVCIPSVASRFSMSIHRVPTSSMMAENGIPVEAKREVGNGSVKAGKENHWEEKEQNEKQQRSGWKEYLEQAKELIEPDGGPPRWFSPLECGSQLDNSPLMLFLPGIDGVGLALILHHEKLGRIFDLWCLHIPVADRTPFTELLKISVHQRDPYILLETL